MGVRGSGGGVGMGVGVGGSEDRALAAAGGRSIDARVSSLETAVAALTDDVRAVARSMEGNADKMEAQVDKAMAKLDMLGSRLTDARTTNWPVLISLGSLIVVVMGAVLAACLRPIDVGNLWRDREEQRMGQEIKDLREQVVELRIGAAAMGPRP